VHTKKTALVLFGGEREVALALRLELERVSFCLDGLSTTTIIPKLIVFQKLQTILLFMNLILHHFPIFCTDPQQRGHCSLSHKVVHAAVRGIMSLQRHCQVDSAGLRTYALYPREQLQFARTDKSPFDNRGYPSSALQRPAFLALRTKRSSINRT